jgi:membrane protein
MRLSTFAAPIGWKEILRRTSVEIRRGACFGWAAQLAYYFFFALFPALLLVVSLAGFLPIQGLIDRGVGLLGRFAPGDVLAIAREQFAQVTREPNVGLLLVGLVGAVWSASSGMTASIDTLNQVHQITEGRPWWRVRVTAMLLTFTLATLTLIALTLVMVGPIVAAHIANWLGLGPLVVWAWSIVRWPAAFALVAAAVGCVYHFAPDVKRDWVWITPGSVAATVLWLLVSLGFKLYVSHFGSYQKTYGALGGVMVTLLWFYLSALAILLGAQLDATIETASHPQSHPSSVTSVRGTAPASP